MAKAPVKSAAKTADEVADEIAKMFGANAESAKVDNFLSTGYPPLDYALSSRYVGGGMPVGRIIEIFGPPSAGKTAISNEVMKSTQRAGGFPQFQDHERSFDEVQGAAAGLDTRPGRWGFMKPRTFEESIDMTVERAHKIRQAGIIDARAPITFIYDSLGSMVPKSKLFDKNGKERSASDLNMHDKMALPAACAAAMPAFNQMVEELGICAIFLNQLVFKPGVLYGDPTTSPGGDRFKFFASVRVQLGAKKLTKGEGENAVVLGQEVGCKIVKNKVTRPFQRAKWRFMFNEDGTGSFDTTGSMIIFLHEQGLIEKSGAYYVWDGKKLYLPQMTQQINSAGEFQRLVDLLPANHEPSVSVAEEDDEAEAA